MWRRGGTEKEIALEDWKRVVAECAKAKLQKVEMFGGDALLRPDILFPLIRYATEKGIECDLVTNGILLDEEASRQIVLAGTKVVYLSIDGVGETHDAIRGVRGAFDKALAALRNLKSAKEALSPTRGQPELVVNTTVSKRNVREMEALLDFVEKERPDVFALEYVGQISDAAIHASAVGGILPDPYFIIQNESSCLSREEAKSLKEWIEEKRITVRPKGVTFNTENVDALSQEQMSSGLVPWRKCYVCRSTVLVDPSGNVLCCPFFSKYSLGDITREPLSEIWRNSRHRLFIRTQAEKNIAICQECILTVQRNPTLVGALVKRFSQYWKSRKYKVKQSFDSEEGHLSKEPC
jgi:radical SAM protein with 4Fe4S-binding SPASM domain